MGLIRSLATVKHFQKLLVTTQVGLILNKTCASKSEQVLKLHPSACVAVRKNSNVLLKKCSAAIKGETPQLWFNQRFYMS